METWRPIPGTTAEASSLGRIRGSDGRVRKQNGVNSRGYKSVGVDGHVIQTHILVALAFHGPPTSGAWVRHLNDVKTDNRPENLAYGTRSDNRRDAVSNGIDPNARKTHCPKGHEYTDENTRRHRGKRICRACDRLRNNKQYRIERGLPPR